MAPQQLFVATVAVCLINGFISPMLPVAWHLHPVWMPEMLPATRETIFYGASLIVSTGTLLLAGAVAGFGERLGLSLTAAMWLWLGAAILLTGFGLR